MIRARTKRYVVQTLSNIVSVPKSHKNRYMVSTLFDFDIFKKIYILIYIPYPQLNLI